MREYTSKLWKERGGKTTNKQLRITQDKTCDNVHTCTYIRMYVVVVCSRNTCPYKSTCYNVYECQASSSLGRG